MAEYRTNEAGDRVYVEKSGGGIGRTLAIVALIAGVIVAILFATGMLRMNATSGALPEVDVSTKGGALPSVDVDAKKVVVGTRETTVDVPKVTTEKETVSVPTIGTTEGETDKK